MAAEMGDLEAAVMSLLWEAEDALSVRQVLDRLQPHRKVAYTTVMTVMDRLFKKGILSRSPAGNAFLYSPSASRADYTAALMTGALASDPDRASALVHFTMRLSDDDADALRRALRRGRRTRSDAATSRPQ